MKFQKYKGRVVLCGDAVNDDAESCAETKAHGSSAGEASDEVSAYT